MPDFAVPPNELTGIAYECGVISSLYYASTEIYHIGRENIGLGPEKQAARAAMSEVASKLIDNAMTKHLQRLFHKLDSRYKPVAPMLPGGPDSNVNTIHPPLQHPGDFIPDDIPELISDNTDDTSEDTEV